MGCNQNCDQGRRCDCAPEYQTKTSQRVLRWLIHFDIWVMSLLGGKERETLSAAAWNAHLTGHRFFGWTHHLIDALFRLFGEKQHCKQAWEWQQGIYQ